MDIRKHLEASSNQKERKILLKEIRKYIETVNKKYPADDFLEVQVPPDSDLSCIKNEKMPIKTFRSREYLAAVYVDANSGYTRISVNRTAILDSGDWVAGISWETLQWIKDKIGFADYHAVEVYPKTRSVVNVANIRHLFILKEALPFIWNK